MGLIARRISTGQRINIADYAMPRRDIPRDDVECHLCGGPLIIKNGMRIRAHFAHRARACATDYAHHPESLEHRFFKDLLARQLGAEFAEYLHATPHLEYPIPAVRRVADIAFVFPGGWIVVHEVQLAPITVHDLEARTNAYHDAGCDVVWWLGKGADTPSNRAWVAERFGECFTLDYQMAHAALAELPS